MKGEEILEKRKAKGMTQEQLAHKLGVAVATVQRWERGHHSPSPMAQAKLKAALR